MHATPAIRARGLTKRFNGTLAVDGLDLEVHPGEVFGFLGPNGAGKTTTVRLLTCLIAPTSGEAWIHGRRVGVESKSIRARIGVLTGPPGLYERLSARKNLEIFARLYGLGAAERDRQIRRHLEILGLWERRDDVVVGFSKGMKQKLAIARCLLHAPPVVFLDEPTSGLDPESARVVRHFIAELKAEGRTIFLCTHNLDEADRLCDRIGVFKQRLICVDTPDNLRRQLYGRQVVIQLAAIGEPVLAAARALPFVRNVRQEDSRLILSLNDPEQQNPALLQRVIEAGGEVQFVTERRASLEDVYFWLMANGR